MRDNLENKDITRSIKFCDDFIVLAERLEKFYKGMLYAVALHVSKNNNLSIPASMQKLEKNYLYFLEQLKGNRNK